MNQTPEDALRQDQELVARGNGWTYEEANAQYLAAEDLGAIAEVVAEERPDIFVGSALSEEPGGSPAVASSRPGSPSSQGWKSGQSILSPPFLLTCETMCG